MRKAVRKPFSTKHFTWLHVPKTGGTWMYPILKRLAPPSWEVTCNDSEIESVHVRLWELPVALEQWVGHPERLGLPVLAAVRNPWDWYVSLYFFMEGHRVANTGGFLLPKEQWPPGLNNWVANYSHGLTFDGFQKALPRLIHDMHTQTYIGARPQYEYLRMPDGSLGVTPVRFEGLRKNMLAAFDSLGAEVPDNLRRALLKAPKTNTSGHAHYTRCYTPDLIQLVAKHERWLIDTFEYEF